jgi:hypothetical protein
MNWYHVYNISELSSVNWLKFKQFIRWNLTGTEFCLEYIEEPVDKTGVLTRDEAAAYTKTSDWDNGEPWASMYNGEG